MANIVKYARMLAMALFLFTVANAAALAYTDGPRFGWNAGSLRISHNLINTAAIIDVNLLHFNWMHNGFSFGFNALEFHDLDLDNDDITSFSIMPLQAAFVPVNIRDMLFLSVYGKAGVRLTQFNNTSRTDAEIYGAAGAKFFFFPRLRFNYAPYLSVFFEYSSRNELRFGLGIDLTVVFFAAAAAFMQETHHGRGPEPWARR